MKWKNSYATRILVIDNDHQKLIELTDRLEGLSQEAQPDCRLIGNQLERLIDYTGYHFQREQAMMAQHAVVGINQHIAEHAEFISVAKDAYADWNLNGSMEVLKSLIKYLSSWLIEHISSRDMELAEQLLRVEGINAA